MKATDASPVYLGSRYGLALQRYMTDIGPAYGHSGQTFGYLTLMLDFPEADFTLVVNLNDDRGSAQSLDFVLKRLVDSLLPPG